MYVNKLYAFNRRGTVHIREQAVRIQQKGDGGS